MTAERPLSLEEGAVVFGYYFQDNLNGVRLADPSVPEDVAAVMDTIMLQTERSPKALVGREAAVAACMAEVKSIFDMLLK